MLALWASYMAQYTARIDLMNWVAAAGRLDEDNEGLRSCVEMGVSGAFGDLLLSGRRDELERW